MFLKYNCLHLTFPCEFECIITAQHYLMHNFFTENSSIRGELYVGERGIGGGGVGVRGGTDSQKTHQCIHAFVCADKIVRL